MRLSVYGSKQGDGADLYNTQDEKSFVIEAIGDVEAIKSNTNTQSRGTPRQLNEIKRQVVMIPGVPQSANIELQQRNNFTDRRSSELAKRPGYRSPLFQDEAKDQQSFRQRLRSIGVSDLDASANTYQHSVSYM